MNRHDVFIWDASERGLPKDLAQALEMAEKLSQIKDEPSDKIKRFAQQIEDYVAQQEDEEWDEYLGGFNTLVANCCHAALNVELPDESWERMLALLVEKATGKVGDGEEISVNGQKTFKGKNPESDLRRFLVGPKDSEITGVDMTPDYKAMFVNIQHPGENGTETTFTSHWPDVETNAASSKRPRSATIVITRTDGGVIGL